MDHKHTPHRALGHTCLHARKSVAASHRPLHVQRPHTNTRQNPISRFPRCAHVCVPAGTTVFSFTILRLHQRTASSTPERPTHHHVHWAMPISGRAAAMVAWLLLSPVNTVLQRWRGRVIRTRPSHTYHMKKKKRVSVGEDRKPAGLHAQRIQTGDGTHTAPTAT